ncbi:serine protease [Dyella sp.]|uniref:S1 family peptidase n=1 Tax=Dyella sp. TaxID=1869338 RepID=UPI002ED50F89
MKYLSKTRTICQLLLTAALGFSGWVAAEGATQIRPSIVGGWEASRGQYPFMASIRENEQHACGASLANFQMVITAAHCVEHIKTTEIADQYSVIVGQTLLSDETGAQRRRISEVRVSPSSDLAVLILEKPVLNVTPVSLPTANSDALYQPGQFATVMGWGNTDPEVPFAPDRLRFVDVPILSPEECALSYPDYSSTEFCAGMRGRDACQGDSGGPIIRAIRGRVFQIGVVSSGKGCAEQGAPGVYVNLSRQDLFDSLTPIWVRPES